MKTWIKIALGLIVVGIIAIFLVYKFIYNKPHPDYEHLEASVNVLARELYDAYQTNPEEAALQFNGKVIAVTGTLSKMEAADSLVIAVFVFNQGDFGDEGVRCTMLPKFNEEANRLQPDGEVRIKGFCTGFSGMDVILEKCSIISQ